MKKKSISKTKAPSIPEIIRTAVLGVLVVSLVVLVAVYIHGIQVYEKVVEDEDPESFNKLWSAQGGSEPRGLDTTHLIPDFIGYKQSSFITPRGCVGDADSVGALYDLVKPCLLELFGKDSVCVPLDKGEGEALFRNAQNNDEFIYVRYHVPVMFQMIYAYCADKLTVSEEEVAAGADGAVGAYVSELIIVSENDENSQLTVAYAVGHDGEYYEFRPKNYTAQSSFYISKLANNDSGITTSDFVFVDSGILDDLEPMVDSELLSSDINVSVISLSDETVRDDLLRLLGYNPDKVDVYDDRGTDVYIDSHHSQLRIGGGSVSFVTADASAETSDKLRGISVDTLLGYTIDGVPTLLDKLTAADNFIRLLSDVSPKLTGEDGRLCLGDVYRKDDLLIVEYILTYNNIRVEDGVHLRMAFAESTICEFELFPIAVSENDTQTLVPEPMYIAKQLEALEMVTDDAPVTDMRLRYIGGSAEWVALK